MIESRRAPLRYGRFGDSSWDEGGLHRAAIFPGSDVTRSEVERLTRVFLNGLKETRRERLARLSQNISAIAEAKSGLPDDLTTQQPSNPITPSSEVVNG